MSEARILADIVRVDHAGEVGAIRIYGAQIAIARWRAPSLVPVLIEAREDEIGHRDFFAGELDKRGLVPCHMLSFWWTGGMILGIATALLGRDAILTCTEAVERTVHRHMDEQIRWLATHDADLAAGIAAIRDQEVEHLAEAQGAGGRRPRWLDVPIAAATDALVWVSTYGASARLARRLA